MTAGTITWNTPFHLGRADALIEAYKTLDPRPLLSPEELETFYQKSINSFRGESHIDRMGMGLSRAWNGQYYKAFLMGHSGVGKTTELTRLLRLPKVEPKLRPIRLSVTEHLDPVGFQPFDVLLLMMIEVAKQTAKPVDEGGAGKIPSDELLRRVWDWFAFEKQLLEQSTSLTG